MKRLVVIVWLVAAASGCGKRSAAGTIVGGAAGMGVGYSMREGDSNNSTLIGAGVGALMGLVVGGILDLDSRDAWSCPDNEPKCLD